MAIIARKTLDVNLVQRREVEEMHLVSQNMAEGLSNSLSRVELYGNVLAAEGGDRRAYIQVIDRLEQMTNDLDMAQRADFLLRRLLETNRRFSGDPCKNVKLRSIMYSDEMIENDDMVITNLLASSRCADRLRAVNSIYRRRDYMFFPALIELARDDSDMNVVQYALYVLQHVLADPDHKRGAEDGSMKEFLELNDFLLDPHGYCLAIEEMWEEKKTGMLSVHPLVLKKFVPADKMYLPIPYLYDVDCDKNYVFPTADDDRLIPLTFSGRW